LTVPGLCSSWSSRFWILTFRLRSGPFEGPAIIIPPALPEDTYLSAEEKQVIAELESEDEGFVHSFRNIIRQLVNIFDHAHSEAQVKLRLQQLRQDRDEEDEDMEDENMSDGKYEANELEKVREKGFQEDIIKVLMAGQEQQREIVQQFVQALQETRGNAPPLQQVTRMAEALATQLRQGAATTLTDAAMEEIRNYRILRSRLVGQQDTGAGAMPQARIRAIMPEQGRIGDPIRIHLENAGAPTMVAFTGPQGSVVTTDQFSVRAADRKERLPVQVIEVNVPAGAITGPVTVATDQGAPISTRDFCVISV
jgi:hypothetical protein